MQQAAMTARPLNFAPAATAARSPRFWRKSTSAASEAKAQSAKKASTIGADMRCVIIGIHSRAAAAALAADLPTRRRVNCHTHSTKTLPT
ncbi:MAG: hypothetical protein J7M19_02940, partial [Planctomycetes bacterium]|nr:hypothetical protein [Planctomycetota bacterium]